MISIVIPHLNQSEQLRRCLESLAGQAFDPGEMEIVVVDNGSAQPPEDVCAAFPKVRLIGEPVPGPGPARNRGAGVSRGDILAFIDADCTADPQWLNAIAAALEGGAAEVIGGDVRIARCDPQRPTSLEAYESIFAYRQEEYITREGYSGTGNLAMRRETFDRVGPFAGIDLAEDRDWGRRATRMGLAIGYVPEMIVYHPARRSLRELCLKWDRHISHRFAEEPRGPMGRLRWLGLAIAVAGSAMFEARRIISSRRVATNRERWLAAQVLVRIRLYRSGRMLQALLGKSIIHSSREWNRV